MQRIISPLVLSIGALAAVSASATSVLSSTEWAETYDQTYKRVYVKYISDNEEEYKFFQMVITHSNAGEQRLYFANYYSSDKNICSYTNTVPQHSTMIFNGQAVKMSRWCQKSSSTGENYYMYTTQTQKGENYVFNLFRTSTTPVQVQFESDSIPLPVIGFTKAWNTAGGDAI